MIVPSEDEEGGAEPQVLEPQVAFEDATLTVRVIQPTSTAVEEEEV